MIETRFDRGEQDLVVDGFDKVIVRAGLLANQNVVSLRQGRQEDERNIGLIPLLANGLEHIIATKARHGDVAEHEVRTLILKETKGLAAISCLKHAVIGGLQFLGKVGPQVVFVFNAKYCFLDIHWLDHLCSLLRFFGIR